MMRLPISETLVAADVRGRCGYPVMVGPDGPDVLMAPQSKDRGSLSRSGHYGVTPDFSRSPCCERAAASRQAGTVRCRLEEFGQNDFRRYVPIAPPVGLFTQNTGGRNDI